MSFLGLHWIDASILIVYMIAVLAIGKMFAHQTKGENDFFLGGRSLGKWFQFFLSFGNMTDPGQATTTSSSVYRQGAGGGWLALITLFLTPYFWFSCIWFRRVRLTTMADLFQDRFGGRFLASLYAVSTILIAVVVIAAGNVVALKTLQPMMVKEPAAYTVAEKQQVADYHEFTQLRAARTQAAGLTGASADRYAVLKEYYDRGLLQPYVTHLNPVLFYLVTSALVALFVMLGGLKASAVVDALQAVLVIVISVMLIPFGLAKIGGLHGLHEKLPESYFNVFGGAAASEYTWYSIGALLFIQLIGIVGSQANMTIAGSAKNEFAARIGVVTGGFCKRFVTIAWCFCGLIAVALFGPHLSDPDQTWGLLTNALLPVGLIGVMIIGILGGKLAVLGATSVVLSGLMVKNIYEPLRPGKSERHYMIIARLTVPLVLGLGVCVGLYLNSIIALLKFAIILLIVWGAPITMIFIWRRVTETAVRVQVIATLIFIVVIPWGVSFVPALAQSQALTLMTRERIVTVEARATAADVANGLAATEGSTITKTQRIEPVSVYFEEGVVRTNPQDLSSPKTGLGLFRVELYVARLLGFDVAGFNPAQLLTTRYLVDTLLPIFLLIVMSLLTKPTEATRLDRFYVRMQTPVAATLEQDALEVEASYANPRRYDHRKLFPRTNWEFTKWDKEDTIGFLSCCAFVGVILVFFKFVLTVGA